jgi:hypothetical protein
MQKTPRTNNHDHGNAEEKKEEVFEEEPNDPER